MKRSANRQQAFTVFLLFTCLVCLLTRVRAQESYSYKPGAWQQAAPIRTETQFNGYTNYWHDDYKTSYRYGNLYKISMPEAASTLAQAKIDVADDMGLPGLLLQEGFVSGLLSASYTVLNHPTPDEIGKRCRRRQRIGHGRSHVGGRETHRPRHFGRQDRRR